ncbi:MAG: DUF1616 domain-containing protein, partial [Candidatus Brockarchaeota archaeon]|nr:DUF1616 domain-containing protein [Candidatus Brockarchaeota archaeon]
GCFTASQAFFAGRTVEPFSELAILGPRMKIADYPREVVAGESFKLYLYVGNHEGRVMYYAVLVKLGNRTTEINETQPMNAPVIARYEVVLQNGGNFTRPITLSIGEPGLNYRLVFELWIYDEVSDGFKYHGRWCQLWLNATPSAAFEGH